MSAEQVLTVKEPVSTVEGVSQSTNPASSSQSSAESATDEKAKSSEKPSTTFQMVARRERALQRQRDEIAATKKALEREKLELNARLKEIETKYAKPENPLDALKRYGWNYKDATDFALNDGQPTAEQIALATKSELAEFKREQEKKAEEAQAQARKAAEEQAASTIKAFKAEITEFIKVKSGDFPLVSLYSDDETIYDVIEEQYNKTGKVMAIEDAAGLVEKFRLEQAEKILGTKYFKERLKAPPAKEEPTTTTKPQATPQARHTVSNEDYTASTPTMLSSQRIEDDRMRRAIAALG